MVGKVSNVVWYHVNLLQWTIVKRSFAVSAYDIISLVLTEAITFLVIDFYDCVAYLTIV